MNKLLGKSVGTIVFIVHVGTPECIGIARVWYNHDTAVLQVAVSRWRERTLYLHLRPLPHSGLALGVTCHMVHCSHWGRLLLLLGASR